MDASTMEPTPPRKPKENRPFYAPPEDKPIAVQIINEARLSLKDIKTKRPFTPREDRRTLFGPRPVNSSTDNRPPSAFSLDSRHFDPDSRPVSGTRLSPLDHMKNSQSDQSNKVAKIRNRYNQVPHLTQDTNGKVTNSQKTPQTKAKRSALSQQVAKLPSEAEVEGLLLPPKPPNDPNKSTRKGTRTRLLHANSVDSSQRSDSSLKNRSNSLTDVSNKSPDPGTPETTRRVHSGPKERTPIPVEERGEGDGIEAPPYRAPSSAAVRSPPSSAVTRGEIEERLGSGGSKRIGVRDGEERVSSGGSKRSGVREERASSGGTKRTSSAGSTGRGGSAGRTEEESQEDTDYYNEHIAPMLEEMADLSKKKDVKMLCEFSDELHRLLEKQGLLGKNYKQRSRILKAIFKMLDLDEPKLLLRLARLILAFRVAGNNLLNVCKLVFKVSRNEKNDPAFLEGNILDLLVETLGSIDVSQSHEALIYCIGALKFLTGNATIAKQLVKKDCVERLATCLNSINKSTVENGRSNDQLGHILVQLTAALRNLADANTSRDRLLNCRVLDGLCLVSDNYCADGEIILNVSRIFSKVTLHTDCCLALAKQTLSYRIFLMLLKKHLQKQDIVVRICFILGNMTAKNDDARLLLHQEKKSLDIILTVLKSYLELDIKSQNKHDTKDANKQDSPSKELSKTEDVLIKVVRVIANISINETVGPQIAASHQCLDLLLSVLECKDIDTSEELVLNTVACINNLSYFNCKNSAVTTHQIRVIECLMRLVYSESMMKAVVEVCRVFGNLTRQKHVRDFLTEKRVDVLLITLLDSGDKEVVYIACGVLINFMVDEEKRAILKSEGGITKLVEVLRDFGRGDWELAGMVCQTLWNYSGKITSTNAFFGEHEAQELIEILIDFLDKESAFEDELSDMDEGFQEYVMESWETQFCPVGEQLLQRLESHQSNFEPLP